MGPAISRAHCTESEGDAVHSSQERDGRYSGSADLDDDAWKVRQHDQLGRHQPQRLRT
jgi:hypothetical protein